MPSRHVACESRVTTLATIVLIGMASITVRLLFQYDFETSALLYVGVPHLIAIAIVWMRPIDSEATWWHL